jgi:hypothetical protein
MVDVPGVLDVHILDSTLQAERLSASEARRFRATLLDFGPGLNPCIDEAISRYVD